MYVKWGLVGTNRFTGKPCDKRSYKVGVATERALAVCFGSSQISADQHSPHQESNTRLVGRNAPFQETLAEILDDRLEQFVCRRARLAALVCIVAAITLFLPADTSVSLASAAHLANPNRIGYFRAPRKTLLEASIKVD